MRQNVVSDIMNRIDYTRTSTKLPYRAICKALGVPPRTYRRWRRCKEKGRPYLSTPGPAKTGVFDPVVLSGELTSLSHGVHRTAGIGRLYGKYSECLSRREIAWLAEEVRREINEQHRQNMYRCEWLVPGMVWSIDGTDYPDTSEKRELMTVRDLASKYEFQPMATGWIPCSEEVAAHSTKLLLAHDAPLLWKMDNGGNLVGQENMVVLAANRVIPLISPPAYPQYNGSRESAQGAIKEALRASLPLSGEVSLREFQLHAALAAHDLNHRPRDILKGQTPCQVFHDQSRRIRFTQPERMAIYDWIKKTQEDILNDVQCINKKTEAAARRKAIVAWLVKNNFIKIYLNGLNVTQFFG
jgi:hypothetical protein